MQDEQLKHLIKLAHQTGLQVMLRPFLVVNGYKDPWWAISPTDVDAWFDSYGGHLLRYARIAQSTHVEVLAIGNELDSMEQFSSHWMQLIAKIRGVCTGSLTYSDPGFWTGGEVASFFSSLDLLGVPFYYPGSGEVHFPDTGSDNPALSEIIQNIQRYVSQFLVPYIDGFDKDVVILELAVLNADGLNREPQNYHLHTTIDNQEAVDYYEAAMEILVLCQSE